MEMFYIIVVSIAIIFLIVILTLIGIAMRYQNKSTVFPPMANDCPDFWTIAADGKSCSIPSNGKRNVGNLYVPVTDTLNISYSSADKFPTYTPGTNGNVASAASTINFADDAWSSQGQTAICAKKKWAVNWGISWDGVTNYNSC
jgi:hypothetical protein